MTVNDMMKAYHSRAYTSRYIIAFKVKGVVYFHKMEANELDTWIKADRASRGAGMSARLKPGLFQKMTAIENGAQVLCTEGELEETAKACGINKGEAVEKLVTEMAGQVWEKDWAPFWEAGDIEIDGIAYQIKYELATFTNEKTLARWAA